MERQILDIEEIMRRYDVLAGKPFDEDLAITFVIDLCVKYLKGRLELATKDRRTRR